MYIYGYNLNDKKGITLIALIITIIVLLILAGVSINMITGDDGLIAKAGSAKERTAVEQVEEELKLKIADLKTEQLGKISNAEIEDLIKTYDKDGKIKSDDNGKYIETEDGYRIDVSDIFVGNMTKSTIRLAYFEENVYEELPILETSEKINLDIFEIKDLKLFVGTDIGNGNIQSLELDIHKGEYDFDYIDIAPFFEEDYVMPSILVDSNWKVCSDLSGYIGADDYHLILLTSESDIEILKTSNYYTAYSFWLDGWYNDPTLYNIDLIGTNGIYADIYWYYIEKDGEIIYDVGYLNEGFEEAKELAENLKNMDGAEVNKTERNDLSIECEGYTVTAGACLYYDGCPIFTNRRGSLNYDAWVFGPQTIFDATYSAARQPARIRNKTTLVDISSNEFLEKFESYIGVDEDGLIDWVNSHEYYLEDKFYAMNNGKAILF